METKEKSNIWIYVLVFVLVVGWFKYNQLKQENTGLRDSLDEYQSALQQANQGIEEANSTIEDAQSYAWSSYEDMGNALENLYTVDTISEP